MTYSTLSLYDIKYYKIGKKKKTNINLWHVNMCVIMLFGYYFILLLFYCLVDVTDFELDILVLIFATRFRYVLCREKLELFSTYYMVVKGTNIFMVTNSSQKREIVIFI